MADYILSCCSTADLSANHFEARDIHYICFHYTLDGKNYPDDLGQSMPFDKFYQAMLDGADTRTSQVNVEEYTNYFEGFLKEGKDVVHLSLSSGISGSFNSACIARDDLKKRYPDRCVYVIDSLCASSGFGLLADKMADLRDEGMSAAELAAWLEDNKRRMHAWFFSTDLTFYVKGGRVSKVSGWFGTRLNICPLLNMDYEGHLTPRKKLRGKNKVIREIVASMEEHVQDGVNYSGKCYMSHSACLEDAQAVAALVKERFPRINGEVLINNVGTTIGSHTGPGTVALFFWGDERLPEKR